MALSRLLHFYKRGLSKSTRSFSSSSSSSKSGRENCMEVNVATEQKSLVEDSDLNKETNLEIKKLALHQHISWHAFKRNLSNLQAMLLSPKYHNKVTVEGTVFVGDKMPSENIMTDNGLQKPENNNTMTSEAIVNSQSFEENISTSSKSDIIEGNSSLDVVDRTYSELVKGHKYCDRIESELPSSIIETNSGDTLSSLMEDKIKRKQLTEDNFSDNLENMVASDIGKTKIDSNSSEFSKNGSVFQSSKEIVDSESKKKYSPESATSHIERKSSSEDMSQSEFKHTSNQVAELILDILGALKSETQYVSHSTSQLPHKASGGLQKDAANGLPSIGQGNQRTEKKTKTSQKLGDSFAFSEISEQCDGSLKDVDLANVIINSTRDQTTKKLPIVKSSLSDDHILQKTSAISNNIDQVIKSFSMKKSQGMNGSQDYDPKRNNLLQKGHAMSKVGNKPNKSEEDSLSGTPLRTIGDVRKARSKSVLEVADKDCMKLKSKSQIHLSTGQGNLSEDK